MLEQFLAAKGTKKELQAARYFSVLIAYSIPCSTGVKTGSALLQAPGTAAGEHEEVAGEDNFVSTSPPEPPGQCQHPNLAVLPAVPGKSPFLRHALPAEMLPEPCNTVFIPLSLLSEDPIFPVPCGS